MRGFAFLLRAGVGNASERVQAGVSKVSETGRNGVRTREFCQQIKRL